MKTNAFHNTIDLQGKDLEKATQKAKSQEKKVLELFNKYKELTSSQAISLYISRNRGIDTRSENVMINSVRRAISNLKNQGVLEKTEKFKEGNYGKRNYIYELSA